MCNFYECCVIWSILIDEINDEYCNVWIINNNIYQLWNEDMPKIKFWGILNCIDYNDIIVDNDYMLMLIWWYDDMMICIYLWYCMFNVMMLFDKFNMCW